MQWIISLQSWPNSTKIYLVITALIWKISKQHSFLRSKLHCFLLVLISTSFRSTCKWHFIKASFCNFWNSFSRKIFSGDSKMAKLSHCEREILVFPHSGSAVWKTPKKISSNQLLSNFFSNSLLSRNVCQKLCRISSLCRLLFCQF